MKRLTIAFLVAVAFSLPAAAQHVVLDIPSIPGESDVENHEEEIDVLSWSQSVANVGNMPVVLPLVIVHDIDSATPKLIEAALMGTDLLTTTLTLISSPNPSPLEYFVIKLDNTKVVSVKTQGGDGSTTPVESVTLTCSSFEITYREIMEDGSLGPPVETTGNCGN